MMMLFYKKLNKAYSKVVDKCEKELYKLYDELSVDEKKIISFEKFASYYTVDMDVEYKNGLRKPPVLTCKLRLKTVEELMMEE